MITINKKSIFYRAIKLASLSSVIMLFFILYRMLTLGAVGTPLEILFRFVVTCFGVFIGMYFTFVLYLFFNPDADEPRER